MSLSHPLFLVAAEEAHDVLPMPAYAYGAIALGAVFALLAVVWMFRSTAQEFLDGHAAHQNDHGDAHHHNADIRHDSGQGSGH